MAQTVVLTPRLGKTVADALLRSDNETCHDIGARLLGLVHAAQADPGPRFQINLVVKESAE